MRAAQFDVISANDLSGVLSPAIKFESQKEQQQRHSAVLAVLRELGATTYAKKIWLAGKTSTRAWILRNHDEWRTASTARVKQARLSLPIRSWHPASTLCQRVP